MCSPVGIDPAPPFVGETTLWSGVLYHSAMKNIITIDALFSLFICEYVCLSRQSCFTAVFSRKVKHMPAEKH